MHALTWSTKLVSRRSREAAARRLPAMPQWRELGHALAFLALAGAALAIVVTLVASMNSYLRPFAAHPPVALITPDERIISSALANAMFASAEPHELLAASSDVFELKLGVSAILSLFKFAYGGLWVGGRVTLTTHRLVFPNALNRLVHQAPLSDVALDLANVTRVTLTAGLVTDIVEVEARQAAKLTFRCFGAAELSDLIKATAATRAASLPSAKHIIGQAS